MLWRAVYERAIEQGSGELVTIMGTAGVGKSRLSAEFLAEVADGATVLTGQCAPCGEGIAFRPIVSAIRDLCGVGERDSAAEARDKLWRVLPPGPDAELVGDRLAGLLGLSAEAPGILETFWAVRKLLEHLGKPSPVVVLFDDIQWAEPTFLDLLEYLVDWIQSAPVLLICLATGTARAAPGLDDGQGECHPDRARAAERSETQC